MPTLIESLLTLVVWVLVLGLIFWLMNWAIARAPEPFKTVGTIVLVFLAVITLIYLLLEFLPLRPIHHG